MPNRKGVNTMAAETLALVRFIVALIVLNVATLRFGVDSRPVRDDQSSW